MTSSLLKKSIQEFNKKNFSSALEIALLIRKSSKEYSSAKKIIGECYYNIGVGRMVFLGDMQGANESYKECLNFVPNHEMANNNLAAQYFDSGNVHDAILHYKKSLSANALNNFYALYIGLCYERVDDVANALNYYNIYSKSRPLDGVCKMREALLIKSIIPNEEYIREAREVAVNKLSLYSNESLRIENPAATNGTYFYFSYHGICNRSLNTKIAEAYIRSTPSLIWVAPQIENWSPPISRIRVGILSENLREHSIGHTSSGIVSKLDRTKFEVIVIHLGKQTIDSLHLQINANCDQFFYIDKSSIQEAREAIADIKLDIAFWQDIGMNPLSYFLAFARIAPIQMTTFGHPDTTGIPNMDYFISSDLYETSDSDLHYSEKLIRIPNAGTLSYYARLAPPLELERSYFNLSMIENIYICPQTLFKIHPEMDEIFYKIFELDENLRFVFIEPKETHMKIEFRNRILKRFPELESKLTFIPRVKDPLVYRALLKCANVMLDTIYFNGQNTNLEAFSVELPVVTLPTALHRGRHTYGMYKAMNFMSLVATTHAEYAELAVRVANDMDYKEYCKSEILNKSSILYENIEFVKNLEFALINVISNHHSV